MSSRSRREREVPVNRAEAPIRIPSGAFSSRREALSELLLEADVDAWIAYGDDGAVAGPGHVRYLTDLEPHFEPILVLRRSSGEELLVVGPETFGFAAVNDRGAIGQVIVADFLGHSAEEYPTIELVDGVQAIRSFLAGVKRLGLVGWDRVPHTLNDELAPALRGEGRSAVDADPAAYRLRAVKSPEEHRVMDTAFQIALAGIRAAAGAIRPGLTERQVVAEVEAEMRRAGAEGFGIDTMVASGVANTQPIIARSTHRVIESGDLVTVTVAPRYEGYHAAMGRPFLLGPQAAVEHALGVAREAQRRCAEAVRVEHLGWEAEEVARRVVAEGSTGAEYPYVGIASMGTIEFEPPIFASTSGELIREGMALSIDIPLFHAPWGGFRIEDGFVVGASGASPRIPGYQDIVPLHL